MSGELPRDARRDGAPYRVAVVCLGNICRSPMADVVLTDRLEAAGLSADVEVVSAGTGGWHVGGGMDERAARLLERHGYDPTRHRAQQFGADWFERCDLVLAMDAQNHRDLAGLGPAERVRMFRDFDPRRRRARPGRAGPLLRGRRRLRAGAGDGGADGGRAGRGPAGPGAR